MLHTFQNFLTFGNLSGNIEGLNEKPASNSRYILTFPYKCRKPHQNLFSACRVANLDRGCLGEWGNRISSHSLKIDVLCTNLKYTANL